MKTQLNLRPTKLYDLIISISTLEHIGWDEAPRDDTKILRALDNLMSLLSENGDNDCYSTVRL